MNPAPDFLRPVARPGRLAWAWCATGLVVLGVAMLDSAAAWSARQQARQALDQAAAGSRTTAARAPAGPSAPPAARSAAPSGAPRAGLASQPAPDAAAPAAAARHWLQPLAHPWLLAWLATESASEPGLAWLALEHSVQGTLRLEGLAPDEAAAQQAAQALRAWRSLAGIDAGVDGQAAAARSTAEAEADGDLRTGPHWQDVTLVRTERVAGGQRFEITAQLGGTPAALPSPAPALAVQAPR